MPVRRSPAFRGRTTERDRVSQLLDTVRGGESAVLVVRGEAGIGKSALLDNCAGQASGFRVARIAGMQSETELPFAGLHQLCAPMLTQVDKLPDPQKNALRVAFGLASGGPPDRFLVALAVLSLLAEVAQKRPLLCVIDDAQWLDAASGQVLGFVGRRIVAESVLMLFAVRERAAHYHFAGLPEIVLHGLADEDARSLLAATIPGRLDARIRDRIVAETRGNPLALLELSTGMTAAGLAGGFAVPQIDLPGRLEEHFMRRLEALPESTQRLLLLAAADPTGDVALLWRAAQTLGIERDSTEIGDIDELVDIGVQVQFRHPLVRSAVYSAASSQDRRSMHLALAAAMDAQIDPDRRVWHLALAAEGTDEEVASELERSAGRAQSRGGLAAAAAFLQHSVALTEDPERRADRALAAAQAQLQAGEFDEALRLLKVAKIHSRNELQRAQIDLLIGQMALAAGKGAEASTQLLEVATRLESLDVNLARETYLDAFAAAFFAGELGGRDQLRQVSRAVRTAPRSSDSSRLSDLLLDGISLLFTEGWAVAAPTLREAVGAFGGEDMSVEKGLQRGTLVGAMAATLWEFESMAAVFGRQTELARSAGALAPLCFALNADVFVTAWRGELVAAAALSAETDALTEATRIRNPPSGALLLMALRGDEPYGSTFIRTETDLARARGEGSVVQAGLWAAGVLGNGLGHYEEAMTQSRQASEGPTHHLISWALTELIESAERSGSQPMAIDAVERLAQSVEGSESHWALGIMARCRALVSDSETAEAHYLDAIDHLGRTPLRPENGRAHLLYGEWLRRQKRRSEARIELRRAYDMFDEIGMLAFAERARRELHATGETVRKRPEDTRNDLTPQEEQIARLALEGRTNPEIGAQLFISARTVEWHLRKVFSKLGISSRRELQGALRAQTGFGGVN
jgi:DNA-binding CsgD family transcriptional regulator